MPRYVIEWDPSKAEHNQRKHGVSFEVAAPILRDPLAMTVYDDEHSDDEDRWVTVGRVGERILVMIHTFNETAPEVPGPYHLGPPGDPSGARHLRGAHMKKEYDFSGAERGKFYRPDAEIQLPVYLDDEVIDYLKQRAESKGLELNRLVNDILKRDIALIEAVK